MAAVQELVLPLLLVLSVLGRCAVTTRALRSADLPAEHRALSHNILADIPQATDNSFVWRGNDGSYRFGMKGDDQWRVETRDERGAVQGQYFYRTPDGGEVNFSFNTGPQSRQRSNHPETEEPLYSEGGVSGAADEASLTLQRLHETEGILPYGALKMAASRVPPLLRAWDREDPRLQVVITDVQN